MSKHLGGQPHTPEKITFQIQEGSINNMSKQMERKAGSWYNVRSFQLLINDGNYYLIVYADYAQGNMDNRNI